MDETVARRTIDTTTGKETDLLSFGSSFATKLWAMTKNNMGQSVIDEDLALDLINVTLSQNIH